MSRVAAALLALVVWVRIASADATGEAEATFRAALASGDIDALERLGAARPVTRWTDDAWSEAAQLAVRANDLPRARRDLEHAIATGVDPIVVRRARAELARLTALAGETGEWTAVAAAHHRLVPALYEPGDPRRALGALEQLVRDNPRYPQRVIVMLAIASVWEREGEGERAVSWLREALRSATEQVDQPLARLRAHADLIRTLTRIGELSTAADELARIADAPPLLVLELRLRLERATLRRTVRQILWGLLAVIAVVAAASLRRRAGSWRGVARRLGRPPGEALFLVPVAIVLVAVAYTGNPLVARAVRTIVIAGVVASWISGAILGGDRPRLRRALAHAMIAVVAIGAVTYLAVERGHLIDFVLETWRAGHERG